MGFTQDIRTVLLFFGVFLACFYWLFRKRKRLPPSPSRIPWIGDSFWLTSLNRRNVHIGEALFEESRSLGNIIGVKVGPQMMVYLLGYDLIHETFVQRATEFSDRPNWLPHIQHGLRQGKGLLWQNGHPWKVMRRFTLQAFRDFGVGKTSLEEKILVEVEAASEFFAKSHDQAVSVHHLTSMMISNVIYGIVFGKRFEHGERKLDEIIDNLDTIFRVRPRGPYSPLMQLLSEWLDKEETKRTELSKQSVLWLLEHIGSEISEHKTTYNSETIRDFIDLFIQAQYEEKKVEGEKYHDFGNIFRLILDLWVAGSETTSNTINWSILYLMEYPEVQARCQQQIRQVFGDRTLTYSDRKSLPYVEATLMEIQRIANIAMLTLMHTTEADTTIRGYFIPARSILIANLYSSHMDKKYWDDPEIFNPDRFLDADGNLKNNPAWIPFSAGPRECVGKAFAKMEIFLVVANLLSRFTFKREDEEKKSSFQRNPVQLTSCPLPYKTRAIKNHVNTEPIH